jgi:hypothetical protein
VAILQEEMTDLSKKKRIIEEEEEEEDKSAEPNFDHLFNE